MLHFLYQNRLTIQSSGLMTFWILFWRLDPSCRSCKVLVVQKDFGTEVNKVVFSHLDVGRNFTSEVLAFEVDSCVTLRNLLLDFIITQGIKRIQHKDASFPRFGE
ncbi:hypothetical protein PCANC_02016 [Puccinia coronata f. sp. avenae]|uniref:Uncharacterized protein n=1 Tax=Puccinia coronata f. sp. avenae TaxID=200324 RepID=A0A2N5W208_9BASI|nr:hypothetical protein PCANC_07673 [Puccinia coronata f. sp. avenae]PLW56230.1 hypothetical protein PCANC_02016 [Puccinia coronata f. sp. avenae]